MSDIDFDELDRAVNSLIAKTPALNKGNAVTTDEPVNITPSTPVVEPVPVEPVQPSSAPVSLAGQRSSGRFMDVIHPSTDMRTSVVLPDNAKPDLKPLSASKPVTNINGILNKDTSTTTGYQPTPVEKPSDVPIEQPKFDDSKTPSALESPFIAGAKVEKRPLGAFSAEPTVELSSTGEVSEKTEEKPVSDESVIINSPLPDELQSDILQIESGNSTVNEKMAVEEVPPAFESMSNVTPSIVQQYKEKPTTSDQKTGAIYDTDVYHKAIKPEAKKKSGGWLWIVWIILLLAVGVGAGAIAYFYVLPLL